MGCPKPAQSSPRATQWEFLEAKSIKIFLGCCIILRSSLKVLGQQLHMDYSVFLKKIISQFECFSWFSQEHHFIWCRIWFFFFFGMERWKIWISLLSHHGFSQKFREFKYFDGEESSAAFLFFFPELRDVLFNKQNTPKCSEMDPDSSSSGRKAVGASREFSWWSKSHLHQTSSVCFPG